MASSPWSPSPAAPPAPPPTAFDLRPLSLGEVLDRIFAVYRAHFWLFSGIAALPALLQMFLGGVQVYLMHTMFKGMVAQQLQATTLITGGVLGIAVFLLFAVMHGATAYALSEVYLGRTASVGRSIQAIGGHWLRYIGIAIWQTMSMLWPMLVAAMIGGLFMVTKVMGLMVLGGFLVFVGMFGGLVVGFILYLRNSLGVPASVVEGLTVRQAMRRSKELTQGTKGRIFVVMLISGALYMVAGMLQMPLALVVAQAIQHHQDALWAQAINLFIGFLSTCLVSPVTMLGLALIYFDQRVRREAFDIEFLLGAPTPGSEAAVAVDEPWAPPTQARFITSDAPQPEASGGVYEALISEPEFPIPAAAEPVTDATLPPDGPDHASGI